MLRSLLPAGRQVVGYIIQSSELVINGTHKKDKKDSHGETFGVCYQMRLLSDNITLSLNRVTELFSGVKKIGTNVDSCA